MNVRIYDDGTIEGYAGRTIKKLYLAGPMRGIPEFNFPAFAQAAKVLRDAGYEVFSPHERDLANGFDPTGLSGHEDLAAWGFSLGDALADDLAYIAREADAIAILPGWEGSAGVQAELALGVAISKPVGTVVAHLERFPLKPASFFLERWGTPQQSANSALDRMRLDDLVTEVYAPAMEAQRKADEAAETFVTIPKAEFGGFPPFAPPPMRLEDVLFPPGLKPHVEEALKGGEVRVTSSSGGQKGMKPARFDLLPWDALWTVAELYAKGAEKYEDRNWERGYDWSLSFASLIRHATQFWRGEDNDEETGLPHLASVVFHALALMRFMREHDEFDNRPHTLLRLAEEVAA